MFPQIESLIFTNELLAATSHPELPERLPHNEENELRHRQFVAAACRVFFGDLLAPVVRASLCAPDIPFMQDGTRRDPAFRDRQHGRYVQELERRRMPWRLAEGSLTARIDHVVAELAGTR